MPPHPPINLTVLKKSRRRLQPGDIFAMLPSDGKYLYGRVIRTDAVLYEVDKLVMIYVYKVRSKELRPIPPLSANDLLIPPVLINTLPWSRGYFQYVENVPLVAADELPQHCFVQDLTVPNKYYDEYSRRLPARVEPAGDWALDSYRTVDDMVSKALGIPLAPD